MLHQKWHSKFYICRPWKDFHFCGLHSNYISPCKMVQQTFSDTLQSLCGLYSLFVCCVVRLEFYDDDQVMYENHLSNYHLFPNLQMTLQQQLHWHIHKGWSHPKHSMDSFWKKSVGFLNGVWTKPIKSTNIRFWTIQHNFLFVCMVYIWRNGFIIYPPAPPQMYQERLRTIINQSTPIGDTVKDTWFS